MAEVHSESPNSVENQEGQMSYILYHLGGELYGTPLLSIKEVIKSGPVKPVPYMVSHFRGVINLRGQVISVIDLRARLGLTVTPTGEELVLVVETKDGVLGAMIDDLVAVQTFQEGDIERNPKFECRIPTEFFIGVAKLQDRLVNLVNVSGCVSADDYRAVKTAA
jgi:purine-binding chemotaxis protein CheW